MASSYSYDGSAGYLVDSNIWIDCMDPDSEWHGWALDQLQVCSEQGPLHVNIIVYTELLAPGPSATAIDAMLDVYETLRSYLPWACAGLTATAFRLYRERGGARSKLLPDFYIGAHAAASNLAVLTRDAAAYRSYFPRLVRIAPE